MKRWTNSLKPSKALVISGPAHRDLAQIAEYTQRTWGTGQKRKYLGALKAALKTLRNTPDIGSARDDISPALRVLSVEKHLVFYRLTDQDTIIVVRILHHAMDPAHHLPQSTP